MSINHNYSKYNNSCKSCDILKNIRLHIWTRYEYCSLSYWLYNLRNVYIQFGINTIWNFDTISKTFKTFVYIWRTSSVICLRHTSSVVRYCCYVIQINSSFNSVYKWKISIVYIRWHSSNYLDYKIRYLIWCYLVTILPYKVIIEVSNLYEIR